MKIIIVLLTAIENLPPARNLLVSLGKRDVKVEFITMYSSHLSKEITENKNITVHDVQPKIYHNRLRCLLNRFSRRNKVRKLIKKLARPNDIIWTMTDYEVIECGKVLFKYHHVMQLMELIKDAPIFDELPMIKSHLQRYAQNAEMVIVPEYNRAHIQKAYWGLEKVPYVLPNTPEVLNKSREREIVHEGNKRKIAALKDKKIILYQGTFGYERVLDAFILATRLLGEEYVVVLMGSDGAEVQELKRKYPEIVYVDFMQAPEHLTVTSHAHIGILSYVNTQNIRHFDPLNAIYCAPNKIFEYAAYGVPMIGNDIPGLAVPFERFHIGKCAQELTAEEIAKQIRAIEDDYENMSQRCVKFYEMQEYDGLVNDILNKLTTRYEVLE